MERRASKDGKEAGIKRGTSSSSSSSISSRRKSKTPDNVPKLEESYEKEGVKFWVECFGPGRLVPWTTFVNNIDEYLRANHPLQLSGPVPLDQVLKFMIDRSESSKQREIVALNEWIIFLYRFGPFDNCIEKATRSFFTQSGQMVPWFHGNTTRARAKELLLAEGRPGSFLVRFSETNPKNFTLTYLDESEPKEPHSKHVLLYNKGPLGFALSADAPEEDCCPSIQELIDFRQGWSVPCLSALSTKFARESTLSSSSMVSRGTSAGSTTASGTAGTGGGSGSSHSDLRRIGSGSNREMSRVNSNGTSGGGGGAGVILPTSSGAAESDDESAMSAESGFGAPTIDDDDDDDVHSDSSAGSSPRRMMRHSSRVDIDDDDDVEEDDDEVGPSIEEMSKRLTLLSTMSSLSSLSEATAMLNRAMIVSASGKHDEALSLLDEVLGLGVGNAGITPFEEAEMQARAAKVKGTVLQEMGSMKEASIWYELCVRACKKLFEEAPASVDIGQYFPVSRYVHNQLAQYYISVRAFELVMHHFEQFLALTDDAQERRLVIRDFERLARDFDFWQDITPGILENELETGKALYKEKKNEEAAEQFRKVMQLARLGTIDRLVEARALGNYATVCRDLKRYNDAILSYRLCCRILRILGERQMERRMLNGLSLCFIDANRPQDAKDTCLRLLSLTEREDNVDFVRKRLHELNQKLGVEDYDDDGREGGVETSTSSLSDKNGGTGPQLSSIEEK